MAWTPSFWLRKLDLVREECREDPAFGLPPEEKLERIALLVGWGLSLLSAKATRWGVTPDRLLRDQAASAHRRHVLRGGRA